MEIDKREQEQRDWTGYGSAERPVIVTYYHVQDDHGVHLLLSMNDRAIGDLFGDQATFELHLAARYRSVELVGSGKVIVKPVDQTAILAEGAQEIKRRVEELRAKHPGIRWEPWMPERLDQREVDKPVPATTVPDGPSVPNDSPREVQQRVAGGHIQSDFRPYCAGGRRHRNAGRTGGARTDHHRLHVAEDNARRRCLVCSDPGQRKWIWRLQLRYFPMACEH